MAESTTTAAEQTHSGDVNSAYPLVLLYHLQNPYVMILLKVPYILYFLKGLPV